MLFTESDLELIGILKENFKGYCTEATWEQGTGVITVTNASAGIVGVGTSFTTELAANYQIKTAGNQIRKILSITNATGATATGVFTATETSVNYYIRYQIDEQWTDFVTKSNEIVLQTLYNYITEDVYDSYVAGNETAENLAIMKNVEMYLTAWQMLKSDLIAKDNGFDQENVNNAGLVKGLRKSIKLCYDKAMYLLGILGYDTHGVFKAKDVFNNTGMIVEVE